MHFNQAKHLHKKTYMTYMLKKPSDKNAPNMEVYPVPKFREKRKSFLFFFQKQKECSGKRVYGWEGAQACWY
jgi:hypothetical protein